MHNVSEASLSILCLQELKGRVARAQMLSPEAQGWPQAFLWLLLLLELRLLGRVLRGFSRPVALRKGLLAGATGDRR